MRKRIRKLLEGHAGNRLLGSSVLERAARYYYLAYHNARPFDLRISGEYWLLDTLADFDIHTVIDAGSNAGEWTAQALKCFPTATIHAFEIAPLMAETLAARFADEPRVVVQPLGLSDSPGTVEIRWFPQEPMRTTINLDIGVQGQVSEVASATVTTGAAYARENGLQIDLMKVDCEGFDLEVLRGFDDRLSAVTVIQFEYNETSLERGRSIREFHEILPDHVIGRLLRHGVAFKNYKMTWDIGVPANFVAVRRDREDVIEALRWRD